MNSDIKKGIKLWSINIDLFDEIEELFKNKKIEYFELYVVPGSFNSAISKLKKLSIPIILHAPHSAHGFNIADKSLLKSNISKFDEVKRFAKELKVDKIIVHPGYGDFNQMFVCLASFNWKGTVIENVPKLGVNGEDMVGYSVQEIKSLLEKGYGFCLDFSHAYRTAFSLGKEPKQLIKKFLKLNPYILHLNDGEINKEKDKHLNLGEGDYDLKFLKECIKSNKNKRVTIETPKKDGLKQDIKNLEYFDEL